MKFCSVVNFLFMACLFPSACGFGWFHEAPLSKSKNMARSLLQVSEDVILVSIVIAANETNSTQAAVLASNFTVEGFTSIEPPPLVPASCPANSISPAGSISLSQCTCLPGYEGNASNGTGCIPCPLDTFCSSGKLGLCPVQSNAPPVSDSILDCSCYPGFSGNGSMSCTQCPIDSFCTGGSAISTCTAHAITPAAQSTANSSCYCDRGYYGVGNAPCIECEKGFWCWTGIRNQCPVNSTSPVGSMRLSDCVCADGYQKIEFNDNSNVTSSVCYSCGKDVFCKVCT